MSEQQITIKSILITWDKGKATEYNDITSIDADSALGFPRLSVADSKGNIHNINLNYVKNYDIELG